MDEGAKKEVESRVAPSTNGSISKASKIKNVLQPQNTTLKRRVHWSIPMIRVIKQRHQHVPLMTTTEATRSRMRLWLTVELSNA